MTPSERAQRAWQCASPDDAPVDEATWMRVVTGAIEEAVRVERKRNADIAKSYTRPEAIKSSYGEGYARACEHIAETILQATEAPTTPPPPLEPEAGKAGAGASETPSVRSQPE
jgi:hypothetical protein